MAPSERFDTGCAALWYDDAMMRRRTYATIAAMLALWVVMLTAALACAPSAPAGQDDSAADDVVAVSTSTPMPSPTAGANDTRIGPMVQARISQSTGSDASVTVVIQRADGSDAVVRSVYDFITTNGGTADDSDGSLSTYRVPVALLPRLVQHTQVSAVIMAPADFPYPNMDRALNNVIAAWQAGDTPEQAVTQALMHHGDKVMVFIAPANPGDKTPATAAIEILNGNKVYVGYDEYASIDHNGVFGVLAPVSVLPALAQIAGIELITPEGNFWPTSSVHTDEERQLIDKMLRKYLPPDLWLGTPAASP